jgi:hypothetical protein
MSFSIGHFRRGDLAKFPLRTIPQPTTTLNSLSILLSIDPIQPIEHEMERKRIVSSPRSQKSRHGDSHVEISKTPKDVEELQIQTPTLTRPNQLYCFPI